MNKKSPIIEKVHKAIDDDKSLSFKTVKYLSPERYLVDKILDKYLEEEFLQPLRSKIAYCIHEIAVNAKKANTKRIFFEELGLKINDPDQYELGMKDFKDQTLSKIDHYLKIQEKKELYVQLSFVRKGKQLSIEIVNNVPMTVFEKKRITEKLENAQKINTMTDAYMDICDYTEGSGLGIITTLLMLRSIGQQDSAYAVSSKKDCTVSRLKIDLGALEQNALASLA